MPIKDKKAYSDAKNTNIKTTVKAEHKEMFRKYKLHKFSN